MARTSRRNELCVLIVCESSRGAGAGKIFCGTDKMFPVCVSVCLSVCVSGCLVVCVCVGKPKEMREYLAASQTTRLPRSLPVSVHLCAKLFTP